MITITIRTVTNPPNDLIDQIANFQWRDDPQRKCCMRQDAFNLDDSPTFHVVAFCDGRRVIGHLFCIRNDDDPTYWYYGDLAVHPGFRRLGIASDMVRTALEQIEELGGRKVCCFVDETNTASMELQKKLGFEIRPAEPFNLLDTGNELMLAKELPRTYSVLEIDENDAFFVTVLYRQNQSALHGVKISNPEFRQMLREQGTDERNFLICDRGAPRAWLKVNGLDNTDKAWISMLAVDNRHHREGAGTFAVRFAEEYIRTAGKRCAALHTTSDNTAAVELYRKCGYTLVGEKTEVCADGTETVGYRFEKNLIG